MRHLSQQKRILICTFVALLSGLCGSFLGGQISLKVHSHNCQTQPLGWQALCNTWVAPGAIWQGSTTGLWMGWILGAFFSGLATRQIASKQQLDGQSLIEAISLCSNEIELTPDQKETLRQFLVLLLVKLGNSQAEKLTGDELKLLAAIARHHQLNH